MAGYAIYSLDWGRFQSLIEKPTARQLEILAESILSERQDLEDEMDADDPVLTWPGESSALAPIIAEQLKKPDWYADLSEQGRQIWETAFYISCMNEHDLDLDFRCDSDGVYWDVIEFIVKKLGDVPERPGKSAMSHFGTVPFRYVPTAESLQSEFRPMHSMHPPQQVKQMLTELNSTAAAVEKSGKPDVIEQFNGELLPAVSQVAEAGRMLFIQVDTWTARRSPVLMRCKACGETWSLSCDVSPGGSVAPVVHWITLLTLSAIAGIACFWGDTGRFVAVLLLFPIAICLINALLNSGYQAPATGYQGSVCPKCGTRNWIWPWRF